MRIAAVRVLLADLAITPVNHELASLALGDPASSVDGLALGSRHDTCPLASFLFRGPAALVLYDMNVLLRHHLASFRIKRGQAATPSRLRRPALGLGLL